MKTENIIKKLEKEGLSVYKWQFDYKDFWFCNGTALVDSVDGIPLPTTATFKDVVIQIKNGKSHIYNITNQKKQLNPNLKLGY